MRSILFIGACLLTFLQCFCQSDKIDFDEIKTNVITLEVPDIKPLVGNQISGLIVLDARPDSTSLGLYKTVYNKKYSIVIGSNSANGISDFIKNYLQLKTGNNEGGGIVMVVKKLWLTDELREGEDESKDRKSKTVSWLKGVIAKFEFYCNFGDSCIPLYRFDTSYAGSKNINVNAKEYIRDVLIMSLQKLITTDFKNALVARKKMSLNEIAVYSKQRFNIPILTADAYKKGVYKTYDEFKMNNPSVTNYEIKKDKLSDMIFEKNGNEEYPVRDVWGFCDGTHIYINSADNYFELIKRQNTFITLGVKTLYRNRRVKVGNVLMWGLFAGGVGKGNKEVSYGLNYKLYELDMDTGELY